MAALAVPILTYVWQHVLPWFQPGPSKKVGTHTEIILAEYVLWRAKSRCFANFRCINSSGWWISQAWFDSYKANVQKRRSWIQDQDAVVCWDMLWDGVAEHDGSPIVTDSPHESES